MHLNDRLTIDEKRRTRDGYLTVNARVARAGNVQLYRGSEVDRPDLDTVRVYRPADEVFSADTMQSFAHRPVTLGHPPSSVSSTNWRDVAKGWSDGEVIRDGEFVRVSMLLADADTIAAVENGTRELSMGYDCSLQWTSGVSPSGEAYDAIQRGIRSNHIAVVPQARGGSELRLGDSAGQNGKEFRTMTDADRLAMRDRVRGMPLDEAAALPIYDEFRGIFDDGGVPLERLRALHDGAVSSAGASCDGQDRVEAYRDHMIEQMRDAHVSAVNDNRPKTLQYAADGRPMSQLTDSERAREQMIHDMGNAHRP